MANPAVDYVLSLDVQLLEVARRNELLQTLSAIQTGQDATDARRHGLTVTDLDLHGRVKALSDPQTKVEIGLIFQRKFNKVPVFDHVSPGAQIQEPGEAWVFFSLLHESVETVEVLRTQVNRLQQEWKRAEATAHSAGVLAEQQQKVIDTLSEQIETLDKARAKPDTSTNTGVLAEQLFTMGWDLMKDPSAMNLASLQVRTKDFREALVAVTKDQAGFERREAKAQQRTTHQAAKRKKLSKEGYAAIHKQSMQQAHKPRTKKVAPVKPVKKVIVKKKAAKKK